MKLFVYSVVDSRAPSYLKIYLSPNDEHAKRHFEAICLMHGSQEEMFTDDFDVFRLAEFDTESGVFVTLTSKVKVYAGKDFVLFRRDLLQAMQQEAKLIHTIGDPMSVADLKSPAVTPAGDEGRNASVARAADNNKE